MTDRKILRLTCPVCETRLKLAEDMERFACLSCGSELTVVKEGGVALLKPAGAGAGQLSPVELELIEVSQELKRTDDAFGVGCALATMGVTLVACILLALAIIFQSQVVFWVTIVVALVLLGGMLFIFTVASSRSVEPLLQRQEQLQVEVEQAAATQVAEKQQTADGPKAQTSEA